MMKLRITGTFAGQPLDVEVSLDGIASQVVQLNGVKETPKLTVVKSEPDETPKPPKPTPRPAVVASTATETPEEKAAREFPGWDAELHEFPPKQNQDGSFRKKRGASKRSPPKPATNGAASPLAEPATDFDGDVKKLAKLFVDVTKKHGGDSTQQVVKALGLTSAGIRTAPLEVQKQLFGYLSELHAFKAGDSQSFLDELPARVEAGL